MCNTVIIIVMIFFITFVKNLPKKYIFKGNIWLISWFYK